MRLVETLIGGFCPPKADRQSEPTHSGLPPPMRNGTRTVVPSGFLISTTPDTGDGGKPPPANTT